MDFTKLSSVTLILCFYFLFIISCSGSGSSNSVVDQKKPRRTLAAPVEALINTRIAEIESLVSDLDIVSEVLSSNERDQDITKDEIISLEKEWRRSSVESPFIKSFMTNNCAKSLFKFQNRHAGYKEIFITSEKGVNLCMTNITSDYYQADESWWVESFNQGKGMSYYSDIEYDESAHSRAISIYVPVKDLKTNKVIGVCKAVIDLNSIKADL